MTTGNTTLLGLALPVEGELDGTWGDVVNDSITSLVDSAVAGTTTLSADADVTLTTTVLAANQARQAVILWTASNGASTRNVTAPARSKPYIVINAGTGSIVLRGAGPTAGVTIISGEKCLAAWNGSDFVKIATSTADGVTTFSGGTTGLTPSTDTSGAVTLAGTLAPANGGTGVANGTNNTITFTGDHTLGLTLTGTTAVTLPTTGTLTTLAGTEALSNKDLTAGTNTFPSSLATLTGTQTLTNKTLTNPAINGSTTVGGDVKLYEGSDNGTNFVALKAPDTLAADVTYTLPTADGTNGQTLVTDGAGALSWASGSGSGDVSGPASAGNNAVARYDGTTGKLVQGSSVFIGDNTSGSVTQSTVGAALTNGTYIIQNGITTSGTSIDILGGNMEIRYAGGGGRNAAAGAIVIGGQLVSNSTHRVDILGGEGELSSNNVNIYGGKNNRANVIGLGGNVNLFPGQNPNYAPSSSGNINVQYSTGAGTYAIGWAWSGNTGLPSSVALYNNTSSGGRDLQIASNGALYAVSSSIKYKKDIEDLDYQTTASTIDGLRPIWYRSISPQNDDKEQWSWFGLLAEEVAQVEPRLVQWRTQAVEEYQEPIWAEEGVQLIVDGEPQFDPIKKIRTVDLEVPEPEGVDYARLSVLCLHEIKILRSRVSALEADVALLKNKLN
jgi:hypothetical protein